MYRKPSRIEQSKSKTFYCTRAHKDQAQRLGGVSVVQPPHYGTRKVPEYRNKALEALPNHCNVCGWAEYVSVLEVHHKDKDRTNNDIANLEILCPTHHSVFHYEDRSGLFWNNVYEQAA